MYLSPYDLSVWSDTAEKSHRSALMGCLAFPRVNVPTDQGGSFENSHDSAMEVK